MTSLSQGSPAFEAGLESLARVVHCYRHDLSRLLKLRVQSWKARFTTANPQDKELQCLIDDIRKSLVFYETKCLCCNWEIGGQKVANCLKTVHKICSLAADPDTRPQITLLLRVLRFNRLCPNHDKVKVAETTEWTASVLDNLDKYHTNSSQETESSDPSLQVDSLGRSQTPTYCSTAANTEEAEPTPQSTTHSPIPELVQPTASTPQPLEEKQTATIEKTLAPSFNNLSLRPKEPSFNDDSNGSLEQPLESKPSSNTPETLNEPSEDQNNDLRAYWPSAFDKGPLGTKRFDPKINNHFSALQNALKVACKPILPTMCDSGFVYVYQVEDNDDYVKIGWTKSSTDVRREQWEFSCNRKTTIRFPDTPEPVAVVKARRVEDLCHAELGHLRFKVDCQGCMKWHQEWFKISVEEAVEVVRKWLKWMASEPYEVLEGASDGEWTLKPEEKDKLTWLTP